MSGWRGPDRPKAKLWRAARLAALDRDGWQCRNCQSYGRLEVDHIKGLEFGGAVYDLDNLQALCRPCHFAKTKKEREAVIYRPEVMEWRTYIAERIAESV